MAPEEDHVDAIAQEVDRRFGAFLRDRVNPGADERERTGQLLPRELLSEAARLGLFGFSLPRDIGGEGRDKFDWGLVVEEVARLSEETGLASVIDLNVGVAELLLACGRPEMVGRYATRMVSGDFVCSAAAYESRDPFDYLTTGVEVNGGWMIDGCKPFVSCAMFADGFIVYARDHASGDILAFLVERGDPGVDVDPLSTMGLRSMGFGSVRFNHVQLPADRLVVNADALSSMNSYLRNRRVMTASAAVGHMRSLFDACLLALANRERSGRSVLEFPNVQRTVGEMFVSLEASQAIVHRALAATCRPRDQFFDPLATAAKQFVGEQAVKMGLAVMNLMGGEGYVRGRPWERYLRDAMSLIGGQGAQELLLIQLGQHAALERATAA